MVKCSICNKHVKRGKGSFFRVPSEEWRKIKWSTICRMQFQANAIICSNHFLPTDFIVGAKKVTLMPNAVPHLNLLLDECTPINSMNQGSLYDKSFTYGNGNSDSIDGLNLVSSMECEQSKCIDVRAETEITKTEVNLSHKGVHKLKLPSLQFINEALFDETTNVNMSSSNAAVEKRICSSSNCSKSVQTGSAELRTCGFIEVDMNTKIYNMRCFHCAAVMPIYSWTQFVTHIKENHQNQEETYLFDEDLYAAYDDADNASDITVKLESSIVNIQEKVKKETKTEIYPTEFLREFYKEEETKTAKIEQSLSCNEDNTFEVKDKPKNKVDEIRLGQTDGAIVMDFLDLFEKHSVLWPLLPESHEEYDAAVFEVAQQLNHKWQLNISDFSLHASLNRIKNWYRSVCARGCKNINNGYLQYFQHCEKFLNTTNERSTHTFFCEICESCFVDEIHLQVHEFKKHQIGELPYKCRVCKRRFEKLELLERHESFHNREKKFVCSDCGKRFYFEKHYKAHMKVHQVCEFCGKKSTSKAMYNQHRITHEPPKHVCMICSKGYFQRDRLIEHIKVHRNERDYVCEECGKAFIRQRALVSHKQNVHSNVRAYVCRICDRSYKTANALGTHKKTQHLVLEGTIEQLKPKYDYLYNKHSYVIDPVTKRKRLVCDTCGKTYIKHCNLSDHKIKAHGWIPLKVRSKSNLAKENKNFKFVSDEESIEMVKELIDK